jgi:hypothetical protein
MRPRVLSHRHGDGAAAAGNALRVNLLTMRSTAMVPPAAAPAIPVERRSDAEIRRIFICAASDTGMVADFDGRIPAHLAWTNAQISTAPGTPIGGELPSRKSTLTGAGHRDRRSAFGDGDPSIRAGNLNSSSRRNRKSARRDNGSPECPGDLALRLLRQSSRSRLGRLGQVVPGFYHRRATLLPPANNDLDPMASCRAYGQDPALRLRPARLCRLLAQPTAFAFFAILAGIALSRSDCLVTVGLPFSPLTLSPRRDCQAFSPFSAGGSSS